jgi:SAM-dependent methyltransferase
MAELYRDIFEGKAEAYAERLVSAPYNALYERPAILQAAGNVRGLRVADIGCGAGLHLRHFLEQGAANVVGLDNNDALLKHAEKNTEHRASIHRHDLNIVPLPLESNAFDLVVSSLTLHYVESWNRVLAELARALDRGGRLVFSVGHPVPDFESSKSLDYFAIEEIFEEWPDLGVKVKSYRRPLSKIYADLHATGFAIDEIIEPRPCSSMEKLYPDLFESLNRKPAFIIFSTTLRSK